MTLIGMPEAGRRLGVSSRSAKRALRDAGVTLHAINERALAVEEADLETFVAQRLETGYGGRGRPPGSKNKPKSETPINPDTQTTGNNDQDAES